MKCNMVLFFVSIFHISLNDAHTKHDEIKLNRPQLSIIDKPPQERRKLALFPKSMKKFVITPPPIAKIKFPSPRGTLTAKKPVMPKFILQDKTIVEVTPYREPTRRPLMKVRKFTVEPPVVIPWRKVETNFNAEEYSNSESNENDDANENYEPEDDYSTEDTNVDIVTESYNTLEDTDSDEAYVTEPIEEQEVDRNRLKRHKTINDVATDPECPDFNNEFIIVKVLGSKSVKHPKEDDELLVFSDNTADKPLKSRFKRKVNIIEEENLGTTISGFKFTGRQSQLSHDLTYNNINS